MKNEQINGDLGEKDSQLDILKMPGVWEENGGAVSVAEESEDEDSLGEDEEHFCQYCQNATVHCMYCGR